MSCDAFGVQFAASLGRLEGGQLCYSLLDGMEFSQCQSGQFGDDFARAHNVRVLYADFLRRKVLVF